MIVHIERSEEPLSSAEIDELERKLSVLLPAEYRQFLMSHNGGKPKPAVFRFKHESGSYTDSCVDWFLAIYDGEYDNFEFYFNTYKRDQVRLPDELVPFAHDPGGNLVCIAVDGPRYGAVYFWDHEKEADHGVTPSYGNVHLVADSFNEFLESLTDSP